MFEMNPQINPQITQHAWMSQKDKGDPKTYAVVGTAMEVHWRLGCGFLGALRPERWPLN
jgi:hypothetical protein